MATRLAIKAPARALGNAGLDCAQRPPRSVPRAACAVPPIDPGEPAFGAVRPERFASFARRRLWRSRYGLVDTIVTLSAMVGFTAALALTAGEWLGAPTASLTAAAATKAAPVATPTVAAAPTIEPRRIDTDGQRVKDES